MNWSDFRHLLHECAEKSGEEWMTHACLKNELKHHAGQLIECEHSPSLMMYYCFQKEKTVMLRAEMDGLCIQEKTGLDYCSKNDVRMHACGHDGHMTILCRISELLSAVDDFPVNVLLVFQSSEETGAGALDIIMNQDFLKICPDEAIALHVMPQLKKGFYTKKGVICAGGKEVDLLMKGEASHCALLNKEEDALRKAMHFLCELDHQAWKSGFVSFNVCHGGNARNQTADHCLLEGTVRFLEASCESELLHWISSHLPKDSSAKFSMGYPVLINHGKMSETAIRCGCTEIKNPLWICDDFAFYAQRIPSVYVLMGMEGEFPLHHPCFDFDDDLIEMGSDFLMKFLQLI